MQRKTLAGLTIGLLIASSGSAFGQAAPVAAVGEQIAKPVAAVGSIDRAGARKGRSNGLTEIQWGLIAVGGIISTAAVLDEVVFDDEPDSP